MIVPEELRYSSDHEWVKVDGDVVRIGITDYAQDALGDVVFVQLPEIGAVVAAGDSFGEVESTKSVSEIYAPIAGTVVEANALLDTEPELINASPYESAWIAAIKPSDPSEVDGLLDAAAYTALTEA